MWRWLLPLLAACGPGPLEPAAVDLDCTPQYEPTFDNVYDNTLRFDCGIGGCHAGATARGGFDLSDKATAIAEMLEDDRVIPGDPVNSPMVMRIFTDVRDWQMPEGAPLRDSEQCAIALWVHEGAEMSPPDAGVPDAAP